MGIYGQSQTDVSNGGATKRTAWWLLVQDTRAVSTDKERH